MPAPAPATPTIVNQQFDDHGNPAYVEMPDSGTWVVNRTFRVTLKYRMSPYSYAFDHYIFYRGDLILIGAATYVISESRMKKLKGNYAEIEIDCDSYDQTPTDEVSLEPVEQNPRIERHPLFNPLVEDMLNGGQLLSQVQNAYLALTQGQRQNSKQAWTTSPLAHLCDQLFSMLSSGCESYYLSQWRYSWTTYVQNELFNNEIILVPPSLSLGGVTEEPSGPLGPFLGGLAWLREADQLATQGQSPIGTIMKLTRSWRGGPATFWPPLIYPPG